MYSQPLKGGNKMKTLAFSICTIVLLSVNMLSAQDDIYYSKKSDKNAQKGYYFTDENKTETDSVTLDDYYTADDRTLNQNIPDSVDYQMYRSDNGDTYITNNYYYGDNYDINNNDDYYDYEYAARIRRFNRPYYGFGYYDNCYTNYYWYNYDPYYWGTSIYVSYSWWYPRPRFYWGWNSWSGWYAGWTWGGYGYSPYGYYGYSYWNGYNHGYWNGYWNGYYDGLYGSGYYYPNYYNSFDNNSYYYGHRNTLRATGTYDDSPSGSNTANNHLTFGQKYEKAIAANHSLNTTTVSKPVKGTTKTNVSAVKGGNYTKSTATTTVTKNPVKHTYSKPVTKSQTTVKPVKKYTQAPQPVTKSQTYQKPKNYTVGKPKNTYTKPKQTYQKPVYTKPKKTYNKPTYQKPKTYNKPSYSKPTYHKPKTYSKPSYSKPKPSYSKPRTYSKPGYSRPPSRPAGGGMRSSGMRRP